MIFGELFGTLLACVILLGLPLWDCERISLKMMGLDEKFKNVPEAVMMHVAVMVTIVEGYGKW